MFQDGHYSYRLAPPDRVPSRGEDISLIERVLAKICTNGNLSEKATGWWGRSWTTMALTSGNIIQHRPSAKALRARLGRGAGGNGGVESIVAWHRSLRLGRRRAGFRWRIAMAWGIVWRNGSEAIGRVVGPMRRIAMQNLRRLAASLLLASTICPCFASGKESKPNVSIVLEQPNHDFLFGQPIQLHVVFQNNLKRDIKIEGFCPEDGSYIAVHGVQGLTRTGCTTATRRVRTTARVDVERLSGESPEADQSREIGKAEARSFILKAGASMRQSFDLTETWYAAPDSPGRFKVSLVFKIQTKITGDWRRDATEWEGEARKRCRDKRDRTKEVDNGQQGAVAREPLLVGRRPPRRPCPTLPVQ